MAHPLVAGSIPDSYRRISSALLLALHKIGLDANADKRHNKSATPVGAVCFEVPSDYEITAFNKKLIGSAQVRRYNAALQHGSLPLYGDVSRICEVLWFDSEAERQQAQLRVRQRATTLSEALREHITWEQAAQAVIEAFAECFDISFEECELSASETNKAHELLTSRYTDSTWTLKR
jgi:lipoyl(octanoyl) transferase